MLVSSTNLWRRHIVFAEDEVVLFGIFVARRWRERRHAGRATAFALAAAGQGGVENMLEFFASEMRAAMSLTGVTSIARVNRTILA